MRVPVLGIKHLVPFVYYTRRCPARLPIGKSERVVRFVPVEKWIRVDQSVVESVD
jgi:hypothetical protein